MKTLLKTICESSFINPENGNLNIIGIFEDIYAKKFPAIHGKMVFVWMLAEGKPGEDIKFYFNIEDPTGKTVVDKKDQPASVKMGPNGKLNLTYNVHNVPLPVNGRYTINLFANNISESIYFEAKIIQGSVA